jgi:hypothetical protein
MNWSYISGFFDADGAIGVVKVNKGAYRTLMISYWNNKREILNEIRSFIESELGFRGALVTVKPREKQHNTTYRLQYSYNQAYLVICNMKSYHPDKIKRIDIYKKIQSKTKRNGRYTVEELKERNDLLDQFMQVQFKANPSVSTEIA